MKDMNLTLIGASRGTGAVLARHAVTAGHQVRTVSRTQPTPVIGADAVIADATDVEALRSVVSGADAVIVTLGAPARATGTPRTDATLAVIEAMTAEGIRRLVVQSSYGVGDSYATVPFLLKRVVFPLFLTRAIADHTAQEEVVNASGLDWTVVRPASLTDAPASGAVGFGPSAGGPTTPSRISRADLADLLLSAAADPSMSGRAVTPERA
jgi:kynurenine 3-monooxygenase